MSFRERRWGMFLFDVHGTAPYVSLMSGAVGGDRLTTRESWERHWLEFTGGSAYDVGCEILPELAPWLPREKGLTFLEVGCAPGRILADVCSEFDYIGCGLDYACPPEVIEASLRERGVEIGPIYGEDFLTWEAPRKFDIVASFGLVEHFADAASVIDRHFAAARPGGWVVIAMPNFAGGQKSLHWRLDRANLRRHNTSIMNLRFLESMAERNRAELVTASYAGGHFDFWVDDNASLLVQRITWRTVPRLRSASQRLPGSTNPFFSPYLFAVYRVPAASDN